MARRAQLENVFAWSASRGKTIAECKRKYFNTYYGSWGGWHAPAESPPAQLYLLKKLDSRWAWSGHVAHAFVGRTVEQLLKGRDVAEAETLEEARHLMRGQFSASRARARERAPAKALQQFNGWKFYGLLEHELGTLVTDDEWRRIWSRTELALRWWFRSDWPALIRSLPREAVLLTDDGDFAKNRFAFDDTHVLSSPDFAFMASNGDAIAVDWKAGRPDSSHVTQLTGYGEQLLDRFGAPYERTELALVYLGRGDVTQRLDADRAGAWREQTRASIATMRELLDDPAKNKPRPVEYFPMTNDRDRCRFCQYRKRCGRVEGGDSGAEVPEDVAPPIE